MSVCPCQARVRLCQASVCVPVAPRRGRGSAARWSGPGGTWTNSYTSIRACVRGCPCVCVCACVFLFLRVRVCVPTFYHISSICDLNKICRPATTFMVHGRAFVYVCVWVCMWLREETAGTNLLLCPIKYGWNHSLVYVCVCVCVVYVCVPTCTPRTP